MKKYTLFFGLNRRDNTSINQDVAINWVVAQLGQHGIDGATISSNLGVWKGKIERSISVSTVDERDLSSIFRTIAKIYAHDFLQDAVLFEVQDVSVEFVSF